MKQLFTSDSSICTRGLWSKATIFLLTAILFIPLSLRAQPSFSAKTDFAIGGGNTWSVATGDLNGDGKPDMAATNYTLASVSVLLNTAAPGAAAPSFSPKTSFATGTFPFAVRMGDINGDGNQDLVVANTNAGTISVLLNTTAPGASVPSFAAKTDFAVVAFSSSIAIADINGDGMPDLVVGSLAASSVAVLLNTTVPGSGAPSFSAPVSLVTTGSSRSVSANDFNGDGKPDLAVANFMNPGSVSIFLNATATGALTPSFAAKTDFGTGTLPWSVSTNDLNGDGSPDLAVASFNTAVVSVLLNTTATGSSVPSFTAKTDFGTGSNPISVSGGDFNSDGIPDLAIANNVSASVSVLLNTTVSGALVPTFSAKTDFVTGNNPSSVSINDFNIDGKPDLAISNYGSSSISILLNTFVPPNTFPVANAGPDMIVEQTSPAGAEVTLDGSASYDPDGDALTFAWSEGAATIASDSIAAVLLSGGSHIILLTVDDGKGGIGVDTVVVDIVDTTPPTIVLNGSDTVEVEQYSSYTEPGATISDIADPSPLLVISGSVDVSTVGEYILEYTATDASGNQASRTRLVRVVPPPPPTIIVSEVPTVLWPPNHKYVTVSVSKIVVAAYSGSGSPLPVTSVRVLSVSSDEEENATGNGDGNTMNDIVISQDARTLDLRAERQGGGNGRVYTITLVVKDANGVEGYASYEVWVPANKGTDGAVNDGTAYTVIAPAQLSKQGAPLSRLGMEVPGSIQLYSNYPNPFNPSTSIMFGIPAEELVSLKVYDMIGREVAVLVNEHLTPGTYNIQFEASGLSSGVYVYRLKVGGTVQTKRMMLMK